MSKHPTERVRSVQELQATSMQQSDKALRRIAPIEERLARLEGRLAEKDELISEFREAYGRQADAVSAMGAVVKELESKIARGVDQVLTGLEGRIAELERGEVSGEADKRTLRLAATFFDIPVGEMIPTLSQLQRKGGRPKGSKNKLKAQPQGEQHFDKSGNDTALGCPEQQPEGESQ